MQMKKTDKEQTTQDMVEEATGAKPVETQVKATETKENNPITVDNFIQKLKEQGVEYSKQDKRLENKDRIDIAEKLNADLVCEFTFKEMKITNYFAHLFACSLDQKIKANCTYKAVLHQKPDQRNQNISNKYWNIEKEINETVEEIKKGGLFNSEEWYSSKITTIITEYKEAMKEIATIKNDYDNFVEEKFPNYEFSCNVAKLENGFESVKRVDFTLGVEAFLKIACFGQKLDQYNIALIEA